MPSRTLNFQQKQEIWTLNAHSRQRKKKFQRLVINLQKLPIGNNLHGSPKKIKLAKMQSMWMCSIKNEASISSTCWTRFLRSSRRCMVKTWGLTQIFRSDQNCGEKFFLSYLKKLKKKRIKIGKRFSKYDQVIEKVWNFNTVYLQLHSALFLNSRAWNVNTLSWITFKRYILLLFSSQKSYRA